MLKSLAIKAAMFVSTVSAVMWIGWPVPPVSIPASEPLPEREAQTTTTLSTDSHAYCYSIAPADKDREPTCSRNVSQGRQAGSEPRERGRIATASRNRSRCWLSVWWIYGTLMESFVRWKICVT